jgi:pSer/pThr/pTyr-binding forkhead associated (FHA) protein
VARQAIFTVTEGPAQGKVFAIEDGFVLGRNEESQINLEDKSASRQHAKVTVEKDGIRLADLESANGLFVNERKVVSHFLREGDTIVIGDTTLVFSRPYDPKARRRNFIVLLGLIVVAGSVTLYTVIQRQKEQLERQQVVSRELTETYENNLLGFSIKHPFEMEVWEYDSLPEPWRDSYDREDTPTLGNHMYTDNVILNDYFSVEFWEYINMDYWEFTRFNVEVWDGIPTFADIYDYSITDETFPSRLPSGIKLDESMVQALEHEVYGTYERAVTTYYVTDDDLGNPVEFYAEVRCYVIGRRRYLLSAITNLKMVDRTTDLFAQMFDSFEAREDDYGSKSQIDLLQEGRRLLDEANTFAVDRRLQKQYVAMLTYGDAAYVLQQLEAPTKELDLALKNAKRVRDTLTEFLEDKRRTIHDQLFRNMFDRTFKEIEEVSGIINDDDPTDPRDTAESWRIWADLTKSATVERRNLHKAGLVR